MGIVNYRNFYEVLGVPRSASRSEIRLAYKSLVLKHDPNKTEVIQSEAVTRTELLMQLTHAYRVLISEKNREEYDRTLRPEMPRWGGDEPGDFPKFKSRESVGYRTMTNGPGAYFEQQENGSSDLEIDHMDPRSPESLSIKPLSQVLRRRTFWSRLLPELVAKVRKNKKR